MNIKKIVLVSGAFVFLMISGILCYADSASNEDYKKQQDEKKALEYLKEGNKYSDNKKLDKALEQYRKAITLYPDLPELQYNIGRLYGKIGVWKDAIEHLEKYNNLAPDADDKEKIIIQISKLQKIIDKKNDLLQKYGIKKDNVSEIQLEYDTSYQSPELEYDTSYRSPELVWVPLEKDLTKHTKGPFTVKIRVEGIDEQRYPSTFPRILYYIGTGSSHGYFDMINEGDNIWKFDIPGPTWYRYRSNSLHYQVKVFDDEGDVIAKSRWEIELIDSFCLHDN